MHMDGRYEQGNAQFLGTHDDILLLENDLYQPNVSGKSIDPRLLALLQYFRELYVQKGDLFRRTFPGIQDEIVDFFKNIGQVLSQVKVHNQTRGVRTLQRSLSVGSPCSRSIQGNESPMRHDRFKIRTVVLDEVDQGVGQGSHGQDETN